MIVEAIKPICYVKGVDTATRTDILTDTGHVTLDSERNPEMKLLNADCKIVVFTDNGELSTSALIKKITSSTT